MTLESTHFCCGFRVGGGLGLAMGLFLGALDNPLMQEEMSTKQKVIYTAKDMGRRSLRSAKTFAVMGLIFSAAECVVEKVKRQKEKMMSFINLNCFCFDDYVFFFRLEQSMTPQIQLSLAVLQEGLYLQKVTFFFSCQNLGILMFSGAGILSL